MYTAYAAANIYFEAALLYSASVLIGIGAAILWCAQGGYITRLSQIHEKLNQLGEGSSLGSFNGMFWSFFQASQILGSALVALLHWQCIEEFAICTILTAISLSGCLLFVWLQNPDEIVADDVKPVTVPVKLSDSLYQWADGKLVFLFPLFMLSGLTTAFMFGDFPPLIVDPTRKFAVLTILGVSDLFFSYLLGRLSDSVGRFRILLIGFCAFGCVFLFTMLHAELEDYWFFILAVIMGLGDASLNTQIWSIIGSVWCNNSENAMASIISCHCYCHCRL